MELLSNQLLLQYLKKGDIKILELVYKQFYSVLCAYSREFVKDKFVAEEIVVTIFYRFWDKRNNLPEDLQIKSYLLKSVHNESLNYLKQQKIKDKYHQNILIKSKEQESLFKTNQESDYISVITIELEKIIEAAIQSLPDQAREIFKQSRFEGLKYHEIAEKLNISINTVETQMSRNLQKLKNLLKDYLPLILLLLIYKNL